MPKKSKNQVVQYDILKKKIAVLKKKAIENNTIAINYTF